MGMKIGTQKRKGFGAGYNKAQFDGFEDAKYGDNHPQFPGALFGKKMRFALLKEGEKGLEPTKFVVSAICTESLGKGIVIPKEEAAKELALFEAGDDAAKLALSIDFLQDFCDAVGVELTGDIEAKGAFLTPVQVWLTYKTYKGKESLTMPSYKENGKVIVAGDVDGETVAAQPAAADDF